MHYLLFIIIGVLVVTVIALWAKVCFLRRAAQEIAEALHEKLTADTNTLITVSTHDSGMRKLAADINDHLRLLRTERLRYQQGDQELKDAVTNISHDLRTPLTVISGYLDLLEQEEKSEAVSRSLRHIRSRTQAMKSLTEELFRYSMAAADRELKMVRMDVVRAVEESLLSFYAVMQERKIVPEIKLPERPVFRSLDAGAVNRIFTNIIDNAIKYSDGDFAVFMDQDGSIIFRNTARRLDALSVGRLFDRFYSVETSRHSTGLGLSIAKLLTERMGGEIAADYENNMLTITLRL